VLWISSDLWVGKILKNSTNTGVNGTLEYAGGEVEGFLHTAQLEFGGYVIPSQLYCAPFRISLDLVN
jgi:hypothetical protein